MDRPSLIRPTLRIPELEPPWLMPIGDPIIQWALDLVRQDSTFTCAATARTCWGYVGDPSAANPPQLITGIPANVPAIVGGRWNGSKFLTTATDGSTLNPFVTKSTPTGLVRVFTAYANYAAVGYLAGEQVRKQTTAGNYVYITCLAPGNAVSVTVTDADIGTDIADAGGFNWRVDGYATGLAYQLEAASENEITDSREFTAALWPDSASPPARVANAVGVDGVANAAYTVTDDNAAGFESFSKTVVCPNDSNTHVASFHIQKDAIGTGTRTPGFQLAFSGGTGQSIIASIDSSTGATGINFNNASGTVTVKDRGAYWQLILTADNDTSGNTSVISRFYPAVGINLGTSSTAAIGSCVVDQADMRLNQSFMDSAIITSGTTLARAATLLANPTAGILTAASGAIKIRFTPSGAGQTFKMLFGSFTDGDNQHYIYINPTSVVMEGELATVIVNVTDAYTHLADTPMELHAYWVGTTWAIRAFSVSDAVPAFNTASKQAVILDTDFEVCTRGNSAAGSTGGCVSFELNTNKEAFGW